MAVNLRWLSLVVDANETHLLLATALWLLATATLLLLLAAALLLTTSLLLLPVDGAALAIAATLLIGATTTHLLDTTIAVAVAIAVASANATHAVAAGAAALLLPLGSATAATLLHVLLAWHIGRVARLGLSYSLLAVVIIVCEWRLGWLLLLLLGWGIEWLHLAHLHFGHLIAGHIAVDNYIAIVADDLRLLVIVRLTGLDAAQAALVLDLVDVARLGNEAGHLQRLCLLHLQRRLQLLRLRLGLLHLWRLHANRHQMLLHHGRRIDDHQRLGGLCFRFGGARRLHRGAEQRRLGWTRLIAGCATERERERGGEGTVSLLLLVRRGIKKIYRSPVNGHWPGPGPGRAAIVTIILPTSWLALCAATESGVAKSCHLYQLLLAADRCINH